MQNMSSLIKLNYQVSTCSQLYKSFVRYYIRGKPPGIAKTLSQRLAMENREDPELSTRIDIGFPAPRPSRSTELKQRLEHLKKHRNDSNLEKLARNNTLNIDLDEVKKDWLATAGPLHIRKIAERYDIYGLFGKYAYFTPRLALDIKFKQSDDTYFPVYYGNRLKPSDAVNPPTVNFNHEFNVHGLDSKGKSFFTLVLTNPDGHFTQENKEYIHWMVGNIRDGDLLKGDTVVPFLQPFPAQGTGYQRYIFIMYKHDKELNFEEEKVKESNNLEMRTFSTYDFYRKYQDEMTPAGLSFFQADWDDSLTDFYHNVLNMKEPVYDYDYPEAILKKEKAFPLRQPFNLYLDRYNDPKEVNKRFLEEELAKTHPFDGPEPPFRFPNAQYLAANIPSWRKTEIRKARQKLGRINEIKKI
ncbi:CLUMA_CG006531, isoform A [Clunio marinus]|uniref:Large ribosomal subunit protein mL38 n=1 Tax=Clunio marinus TaxID=568069 RepID=A0A1J1I058_9DIPT|nr:CLUMA_CG006531, isoform A [Clunio marinus]